MRGMRDKCPAAGITSLFLYLVGCETEDIIGPALVSYVICTYVCLGRSAVFAT